MFQVNFLERIKTHFFLINFFEKMVVYEIMSTNIVDSHRSQTIKQGACALDFLINKATKTLRICNT